LAGADVAQSQRVRSLFDFFQVTGLKTVSSARRDHDEAVEPRPFLSTAMKSLLIRFAAPLVMVTALLMAHAIVV
jgi:hypothetical protein